MRTGAAGVGVTGRATGIPPDHTLRRAPRSGRWPERSGSGPVRVSAPAPSAPTLTLDQGDGMSSTRSALAIRTVGGLVVGQHALLLRGGPNAPFGRVAPVVPVWRIVVAGPGPITWRSAGRPQLAAGMLVPPDVTLEASVPDMLAILHLDAGRFGLLPRPVVGRADVVPLFTPGHVLSELWWVASDGALDHLSAEVLEELRAGRLLPPASTRDRRVAAGLEVASELGSITEGAATVGLSRARFRGLVREQMGTSPTRLRTWQRLRSALSLVDDLDLAEAAATAGFADQAHLTRTSTRFLGTSPGRLRATLTPPSS
jgi:AraC-like DNA-binding protein